MPYTIAAPQTLVAEYFSKPRLFFQIAPPAVGILVNILVASRITSPNVYLILAGLYMFLVLFLRSSEFLGVIISTLVFCPLHYFGFTGFLAYFPLTFGVVLLASVRSLKYFKLVELRPLLLLSVFIFSFSVLAGLLNKSSNFLLLILSSALIVFVWILGPKLLSRKESIFENRMSILTISTGVGLLGIFEYLTQNNILGWYFAGSDLGLIQKWGSFRVMTVLGHPLLNGMVFALLGVFLLIILQKKFSFATFGALIITLVALGMTGSRSGLVAFFVGLSVVMTISILQRRRRILVSVLVVTGIFSAFAYLDSVQIFARFLSSESSGSTDYRFYILTKISDLLGLHGFIGGGPLSSASAWARTDSTGLPLENSLIQILTSHGIGLSVLAAISFALAVRSRWNELSSSGLPVVLTYFAAASGFNLYEAYPTMLIVLVACLSLVYKPPISEPT